MAFEILAHVQLAHGVHCPNVFSCGVQFNEVERTALAHFDCNEFVRTLCLLLLATLSFVPVDASDDVHREEIVLVQPHSSRAIQLLKVKVARCFSDERLERATLLVADVNVLGRHQHCISAARINLGEHLSDSRVHVFLLEQFLRRCQQWVTLCIETELALLIRTPEPNALVVGKYK